VCSVVVSLLHSFRFLVRSRASLHLELIALRHQLAVVNRSRRPRIRLTAADRMLWAWLTRMARLAVRGSHRQARDRDRLAPARISAVLDLEKPTAYRIRARTSGSTLGRRWTTRQVTPLTDLYSLGAIAYEMVTGNPPFQGDASLLMNKHEHETPIPPHALNKDTPPTVSDAILRPWPSSRKSAIQR
jgi:serine/threonine protein kinase